MAKKNRPQGGGDPNQSEALLVIGIALILFMLWMAYHTKIATLILAIRGVEAWIISLFTDQLIERQAWIKYVSRSTVTGGQLIEVSNEIGSYIRWVCAPMMLIMGFYLFRKSPTEKFKRVYTASSLPVVVAHLYPWIRTSITNDFSAMDQNKGPWAIARTERQFARMYKLRDENGVLDHKKTTQVFIKQMGALWVSYNALPPHAKALFALFATRANKDFETGDRLLIQLANSAADGKLDMTSVEELAAKYMNSKVVQRVLECHAYEKTVLMSMLIAARGGEGAKDLLPPNWFLWLKGVDRSLWYALSDVGRNAVHVESAGVFGHWLAENKRKKKLEMPWVKNAVEGLEAELKKFTNDDEDEGFTEADDLIEVSALPPAPVLPSPEEVELMIKTGRGSTLPRLS